MDREVLDMLQVKEPKIEKKSKQLSDGNKELDLKKLEFVDDNYLKGKFEKQNHIYDTPGIFNESQVCKKQLNSNQCSNPAGNYMFKVNNRNTRTRCEICSKLTIKTPE